MVLCCCVGVVLASGVVEDALELILEVVDPALAWKNRYLVIKRDLLPC
jgi:hypothetical protein